MSSEKKTLLEIIERHKKVVNIMHGVSSKINASLDLETIFDITFQLLDQYFQFKHIMILLLEEENPDQLKVVASHGYGGAGAGATIPIGKGVIGMVAKNKKLLRMGNVQSQLRLINSVATPDTSHINLPGIPNCSSQLAVPLIIHEDLVGVIAIESENAGLFNKKDEDLLQMIGVQIGIAVNNARQFKTIELTNNQLKDLNENLEQKVQARTKKLSRQKKQIEGQHTLLEEQHTALEEEQNKTQNMLEKIETLFGQQVSKEIANELVALDGKVNSKAYDVTIMFLDIRDFTVFADSRPPEKVAAFQNTVFGEIMEIVRNHKGITNQILGDGIMAVFGAPIATDIHAKNAVAAGFDILDIIKELGESGKIPKIRIGIGLHNGKVIAGNIGNVHRKQYSLTGSTVIIASRIEQLNKVYKSQFLVSEGIYKEIRNNGQPITEHGDVKLKGIGQAVGIYQLA